MLSDGGPSHSGNVNVPVREQFRITSEPRTTSIELLASEQESVICKCVARINSQIIPLDNEMQRVIVV